MEISSVLALVCFISRGADGWKGKKAEGECAAVCARVVLLYNIGLEGEKVGRCKAVVP